MLLTNHSLKKKKKSEYRKRMYHCVLQMALHKGGGTVPLTIPLLKVSLSQLTTSSTRSTCAHANTHVRALKHTQTSQLMGLNLINCSETDTLSLINPFLRLRAHRGALTIQRANAHSHTNTYIWEGGGGLRYIHTLVSQREKHGHLPGWFNSKTP